MTPEEIHFLEVRPREKEWYFVTLFQFKKKDEKDPDYIRDYVFYD